MSVAESGEARAEELRRQAALLHLQADRIEAGNAGERKVAQLLQFLVDPGWVVLHDRRKSARSPANVDHIVIGPPGVFVLDAKAWSGVVRFDGRGLRQNGYRRDDELKALEGARAAVAASAGRVEVRSALVLVGSANVEGYGVSRRGAVLPGAELIAWMSSWPTSLDPTRVRAIARAIELAHPPRAASVPAQRASAQRNAQTTRKPRGQASSTLAAALKDLAFRLVVGLTVLATAPVWVPAISKALSKPIQQALQPLSLPVAMTAPETAGWCQRMTPGLSAEMGRPVVGDSPSAGVCHFVSTRSKTLSLTVATDGAVEGVMGATPVTETASPHASCGVARFVPTPDTKVEAQRRPLVSCFTTRSGSAAKLAEHNRAVIDIARKALS